MSLGDIFSFEAFNLKDMLKKVKKDPERLFLGAADPLSSAMWGKALGKDYEPIVDQMGGAYGGHAFSAFGNTDGGVYGRAEEAGIDTTSGRNAQNVAHVIAAILAGSYGAGKIPQGGQGQQGWQQYAQQMPGQQQQQQQPPKPPPNFYAESQQRALQRAQEEAARQQMAAQLARVHKFGGR